MVNNEYIHTLINYAEIVNEHVEGLEWYVFGSLIKDSLNAIDIDILIIYQNVEDPKKVRLLLFDLNKDIPLHLIFMTKSESIELDFYSVTNAISIFPNML